MQVKCIESSVKVAARAGDQLMKVRITGEGNGIANLKHPVPSGQPASFLSYAAKTGKLRMRLPVRDREKWFHQGSHRDVMLRAFPTLRDDPAILIQQEVGEIGAGKVTGQYRRSRLCMQVLDRAWRRGFLRHAEHKHHRH
jgi:hypothetical protein